MIPCYCASCAGSLVPAATKRSHERIEIKNRTSTRPGREIRLIPRSQQSRQVSRTLAPPRIRPVVPEQEMLDHGFLTQEDLDIQTDSSLPNLGPNIQDPQVLVGLVDRYEQSNAAAEASSSRPTSYQLFSTPRPDAIDRQIRREFDDMVAQGLAGEDLVQEVSSFTAKKKASVLKELSEDLPEEPEAEPYEDLEYADLPEDPPEHPGDSEDEEPQCPPHVHDENNPDPFAPAESGLMGPDVFNFKSQPVHLQAIYAVVTWLRLQFHLPRIACHALLAILGCILFFLNPNFETPLVTLTSANRVLSLDIPIHTLPVCPGCREVYPTSDDTPDQCTTCGSPLWKSKLTSRGKTRKERIPLLRYPYLSISEQLPSILMMDGVEDLMDQWRTKTRNHGVYSDIFDGKICKNLRAHDKTLFFSNQITERKGPNGELRLGVTLGADWYAFPSIIVGVQLMDYSQVLVHTQPYRTIPCISADFLLNHKSTSRIPVII